MKQTLQLGIYQHYKGGLYEVMGTARHSETDEILVIYKALYDEGQLWARPFDMFTETIMIDGALMPRFQYRGPSASNISRSHPR